MKKRLFSLLVLLSFVVSLSAQKAAVSSSVEANLRKHVEYLASDKLEGRRAGEPGATYAAGYIANHFAKLRLRPGVKGTNGKPGFMQPFSYTPVRDPHAASPGTQASSPATPGTRSAYNVIGILDGHDKMLRNEAIVIGAHYDHLGRGGQDSLAANSTEIHHGADDNASGTAAIIEIARQFAKDKSNKRTLIFIAFSGEEDGLFGSKYYVNNPVFPLDKTVAMINLDMVGRIKDDKLTIGGIGTASEWRSLVEAKNIRVPRIVPVSSMPTVVGDKSFDLALNEDGFGPSDHSSFYGKQIPVLFFFTGTHLDYHKPSDTFEKINYAGTAQIVAYVAAIVKEIDADPSRPTYTVAKAPANTGARTGFSISLGTIPTYADSTDGMLLDGVRENSPASKAGLKAGDKLIKLAGKDVKNVYDYTAIMGEMKADVEYEVVVVRGSETLTMKITPAKRP
jgi:aminopeptidase YwaD